MRHSRPTTILTILFGHIGDTLIVLSLFNDILRLDQNASFTILTRKHTKIITDLAAAYPHIVVTQIPHGIYALPFLCTLLVKRWTFLALGLGSASEYSLPLKIFIYILSLIPGNDSIGLDTQVSHKKGWQPLKKVIQPDYSQTMLENFRLLIPHMNEFKHSSDITGKPLNLKLLTTTPKDFPYKPYAYIVVHLFGVSRYRSFPLRRWKTLCSSISQKYPGLTIVFTGSSDDKKMIDEIAHTIPHFYTCIGLPILEVGGIIDNAALYIGVDTGITHLAGVLKQKSLIIRHVGDRRWIPTYNPYARILVNTEHCVCLSGGNCSVIEDGIAYTHCMYDISDKIIFDSVNLALSSPEKNIPLFAVLIDEYHHR
jgi:ADP-heptose:LPS heptosyltransferase